MPMMNALVKQKATKGLWLTQVEKPIPLANEVLIQIKRTSICGTDLHIYNWDDWAKKTIQTPITIGHEFVGTIVDMGKAVTHFAIGDLVSGEGHLVCNRCLNCMIEKKHLCSASKSVGIHVNGAFAEYMVLPQSNVWKHANNLDLDVAALFDPLGNAVHSALQWNLTGKNVLITGAGPVGIMAVAIARHVGARIIVISDKNNQRLALAKQFGADHTINIDEISFVAAMQQLSIDDCSIGLEMSGSASALANIVDTMSHGGNISMLGIPTGDVHIDWNRIVFRMLTLRGVSGRRIFETWHTVASIIDSGLDITPLITHHFDYHDFQLAFNLIASRNSGKIILRWS